MASAKKNSKTNVSAKEENSKSAKPEEKSEKQHLDPKKIEHPSSKGSAKPITPAVKDEKLNPKGKNEKSSGNLAHTPNKDKSPNKDHSPSKDHVPAKDSIPNKTHISSNQAHKTPGEEIDSKIQARKRLLETLEDQTKFCSNENLLQISARDSVIEELNKELVALKAQLKEKTKAKTEEKKTKKHETQLKISELENERTQLEGKILVLNDRHRNELQKLEEEKTQSDLLLETMTEEIEVLRAQLKAKDEEIKNVVADIKKLSEIIQQFKSLNSDLNQKIEKMNSDHEEMSSKYYESEVKIASAQELESSLQDYMKSYQKAEIRANKLEEELRSEHVHYDDLFSFCKFCEEKISEVLEEMPDSQSKDILKKIKAEIGKKKQLEPREINENVKDQKIREISEKLEESSREIVQLKNSQKPLVTQLESVKKTVELLKKNNAESVENISKSAKIVQDHNDSIKKDLDSSRNELAKKETKIASLTSKLSNFENKIAMLDEKYKKISEAKILLEKESAEAKAKLLQTKTLLNEKQSNLKTIEKQNIRYVANIQALHEELWKKDTGLIKSKKIIAQISKTLSETSSQLQKLMSEKTNDANAEKLLKEIQEKNQKIDILKEMVKSSQTKAKHDKVDGLSPNNSMYDMGVDKSGKSSISLINTLALKTINKFFTICSFHRNSPQDSPQDIQRLIKKLRQDLKSYKNFSTKDLASSVPQLQSFLSESKPQLSLDELMAVISKAVNVN